MPSSFLWLFYNIFLMINNLFIHMWCFHTPWRQCGLQLINYCAFVCYYVFIHCLFITIMKKGITLLSIMCTQRLNLYFKTLYLCWGVNWNWKYWLIGRMGFMEPVIRENKVLVISPKEHIKLTVSRFENEGTQLQISHCKRKTQKVSFFCSLSGEFRTRKHLTRLPKLFSADN